MTANSNAGGKLSSGAGLGSSRYARGRCSSKPSVGSCGRGVERAPQHHVLSDAITPLREAHASHLRFAQRFAAARGIIAEKMSILGGGKLTLGVAREAEAIEHATSDVTWG